jgi:thioredoxin reductase
MEPDADAPAPPRRRDRRVRPAGPRSVEVDVVVIGAGQAGLSAAHDLRRARFVALGSPGWEQAAATFVVLDDSEGPGGAWQHRWPGLTMAAAHRVHTLPGMPLPVPDGDASAATAVPAYFAEYEDAFALQVQRPVHVDAVRRDGDRLAVLAHHLWAPDEPVRFRARGVINASGSWGRPFWPACPGREQFSGAQLHARDYRGPDQLPAGHVLVVGGGASAVHILAELSALTTTTWVTRHPPVIDPQDLTPAVRRAVDAGLMTARPMFDRLGVHGAWFAPGPVGDGWVDGTPFVAADVIVWATGFRPSLAHLAPLHLHGAGGRVALDGTRATAEPLLQLVGSCAPGGGAGAQDAVRVLLAELGA